MKYMGSKSRIKKHIVPILQEIINRNNIKTYIEPFVGGANVIDSISCNKKIGYDNHEYLIELYKKIQIAPDCLPKEVSREHYSDVRNCFNERSGKYPKWYIGAVGFLASYNGRWFDGGYSGKVSVKDGKVRDYFDEAMRNLVNQRKDILDIEFSHSDYSEIDIPDKSLVYCDIPYRGVKQYSTSKNFDHDSFWDWARILGDKNIVVISEQDAPDDFMCIWEQEINRTLNNTKRIKVTEKLFVHKDRVFDSIVDGM